MVGTHELEGPASAVCYDSDRVNPIFSLILLRLLIQPVTTRLRFRIKMPIAPKIIYFFLLPYPLDNDNENGN